MTNQLALIGVISSLLTQSILASDSQSIILKTPRGENVPAELHFPPGSAKLPVIVMAPGGNYHKEMPIFKAIADRAVKAGFAAVRFDWAYCKLNAETSRCTGKASPDLNFENEDLRTVIDAIKAHPRVDASAVFVAGKSLGTLVSFPVFKADPSLRALFLMTPLCTETDDAGQNPKPVGAENYPAFTELTRPVTFLLGNQDPACFVPMLYDLAKATTGNTAIVVVGGDHGLNLGRDEDGYAVKNAANVAAAASSVVHWMKIILNQ